MFRRDKDPDNATQYGFDWTDWLTAQSGTQTITTSTWVLTAGITEDSSANTTTQTSIVISGGTLGEVYRATNRITTTPGAFTQDRSVLIKVRAL